MQRTGKVPWTSVSFLKQETDEGLMVGPQLDTSTVAYSRAPRNGFRTWISGGLMPKPLFLLIQPRGVSKLQASLLLLCFTVLMPHRYCGVLFVFNEWKARPSTSKIKTTIYCDGLEPSPPCLCGVHIIAIESLANELPKGSSHSSMALSCLSKSISQQYFLTVTFIAVSCCII